MRSSAIAAAIGLAGIVLFQIALVAGAPWGRAAWGGGQTGVLPNQLRVASAVAVVIWAFAAAIMLRRAGINPLGLPEAVGRWGAWILFGLLLLGALMNVASSSPWERYFWGPYAFVLAGLCF